MFQIQTFEKFTELMELVQIVDYGSDCALGLEI